MRLRARRSFDDMAYSTMVEGIEKLVHRGLDIDTATQTAVDALVSASDSTAPTVAFDAQADYSTDAAAAAAT